MRVAGASETALAGKAAKTENKTKKKEKPKTK